MAHLHLAYYTQFEGVSVEQKCPRFYNLSKNCSEVELEINLKSTYVSIASCTLSCVGSLLIFVAYFQLKGIRNIAQKLITLLALADFFTALGYLMADWNFVTNLSNCSVFTEICQVQSFLTSWSSICSFGWTCALALHFYLVLRIRKRAIPSASLLVWQNVIIWTFPLLIVLPLLITHKLGYSRGFATANWCFIQDLPNDREEIALILLGGKLWEILSYLFVVVAYTLTALKFSKQVSLSHREQQPMLTQHDGEGGTQPSAQNEARSQVKQRLLLIPMLFILLRMWGTIQFFFTLVKKNDIDSGCVSKSDSISLFALGIFQAIGDGGQGWSNAILYIFLSPTIRRQLFVQPFIRLLQFAIRKIGKAQVADDSLGIGDDWVRVPTALPWNPRNGGEVKLMATTSDFSD